MQTPGWTQSFVQESVVIGKREEDTNAGCVGPRRKLGILGFQREDRVRGTPLEQSWEGSVCWARSGRRHLVCTHTSASPLPRREGVSPVLWSSPTWPELTTTQTQEASCTLPGCMAHYRPPRLKIIIIIARISLFGAFLCVAVKSAFLKLFF